MATKDEIKEMQRNLSRDALTKQCTACNRQYGTFKHYCPACGNWEFSIIAGTDLARLLEAQN